MITFLRFALLASVLCHTMNADESFSIFIPDRPNERLVQLSVLVSSDGVSTNASTLPLPFSPSGITKHPNGKQLILSGGSSQQAQATTVDITSGERMTLIASPPLAYPTGYTSVDRSGRFFMTVHYGTGQIATYHLDSNGVVGDLADSLRTPKKEAHCILNTPDNRFVYIPCVKLNNALYQYAFDEETGRLTPLEPFNAQPPAMFGPRHVAYHPSLPVLYFSNEQQLGVSAYSIGKDGQLTGLQHVSTIPRRSPFEQGKRDLHASDIVVTPDSQYLFVALRDFNGDEDSIFTFRIETDGKLSSAGRTQTGDIPWKIDVSPNGNYLITRQMGDQSLSIFKIQKDGSLQHLKTTDLPVSTNDFSVLRLD